MKFTGTSAALVTPFTANGSIDFDALTGIIENGIHNGLNYLVVLGTTGEAATLSKEEKLLVFDHVRKVNNNRVPLVAGFGGNNTAQLCADIKSFDFNGYDAILSASPAYSKPTQNGIIEHYKAVAEACPVDVILYNVPGRTASNMTAETVAHLANQHTNIIGIKEASGDIAQCMAIQRQTDDNFLLISGDDLLTVPMISIGAKGVISVLANAIPNYFSSLIDAALTGDFKTATEQICAIQALNDMMYVEGNPAGIKSALSSLNRCQNTLRLPLISSSKELNQQIQDELQKLN